jgi:glycosyltransferase involved in cell wall biosynthesis
VIAVVIPCHRVKNQVLGVLSAIGPECNAIYVVDDACPEHTGDHVERETRDPRIRVIRNEVNLGVGGATLAGYSAALADDASIIVKCDGDGQMDPCLIPRLVRPIQSGEADYAKGNRFFDLAGLERMPKLRLIGNSLLSFLTKLSSGYWNVFDPTNGFTAIHASVARALPADKIARGFFFESDMLFRLGILRAVVCDVPMPARYGDESSNLQIGRIAGHFAFKHVTNTFKRIFYNYYLRNFNIASIEIIAGALLIGFGVWFGGTHWLEGIRANIPQTSGTVMVAALPVIVGIQLVLSALSYDLQNIPRDVMHKRLAPGPDKP